MNRNQLLNLRNNKVDVTVKTPQKPWQRIGRIDHCKGDTVTIRWHNGDKFASHMNLETSTHPISDLVVI